MPRILATLALATALGTVSLVTIGCASTSRESSAVSRSRTAQSRADDSQEVRYVQVTGSHIPIKVKGKPTSADLPGNLTVVDPESSMNQGYLSPMDMLMKNPWASTGYRGH